MIEFTFFRLIFLEIQKSYQYRKLRHRTFLIRVFFIEKFQSLLLSGTSPARDRICYKQQSLISASSPCPYLIPDLSKIKVPDFENTEIWHCQIMFGCVNFVKSVPFKEYETFDCPLWSFLNIVKNDSQAEISNSFLLL